MNYWTDHSSSPVDKVLVGKIIITASGSSVSNCPFTFPLIQKAFKYFTCAGYEGDVQTYLKPANTMKKTARYLSIEFYVAPEDYDRDIIKSSNKINLHISTDIPSKADFIAILKKFKRI